MDLFFFKIIDSFIRRLVTLNLFHPPLAKSPLDLHYLPNLLQEHNNQFILIHSYLVTYIEKINKKTGNIPIS